MYKVVFHEDGKRRGWVILYEGFPINELYFTSKELAEKYKDRLERLFNRGKDDK